MKRILAFVLAALMLLSLAACGGETGTTTKAPEAATTKAPAATTKAPEASTTKAPEASTTKAPEGATAAPGGDSAWETKGLPALTAGSATGDIILTSVGQSTDANSISTLLKKGKVDVNYYENPTVTADQVTDKYHVLILAVGGSTKGLGSAGLNEDEEAARVQAVIDKAKSLNYFVIVAHIGGTERRGTLSDKFINLAFPYADAAIVVAAGDEDNLIHNILAPKNVPAAYVNKQSEVRDVLKFLLGK